MNERLAGTRLVLVAHGSRDARAARSTRALVRAVARELPGCPVDAAFLDFVSPRLPDVLAAVAGGGQSTAIVVPLLLTAAYHGRVDVPGGIDAARASGVPVGIGLATVLGPVGGAVRDRGALDLMTAALTRRLAQTGTLADCDAVLLAGAGSRDSGALRTVDSVADALGAALNRPCRVGYASGGGPGVAEAVAGLRAGGARRIAVAGYFLAPGLLYDRAAEQARAAGVTGVAAPLGAAPEIVRLVLRRAAATRVPAPFAG